MAFVGGNLKDNDWTKLRQILQKLSSSGLGWNSVPAFAGLTLTGLTTNRVLYSSSGTLTDSANLTFNGTVLTLPSLNLTADTNQIVLNSDGGVAAITLTGTATGAAKTITFPDATGTVALTSDLTTGFVPYTGASATVNLNTQALSAGAITGTSFVIGANTLDTNEWAFLDGQNQSVFTTSAPQFLRLGIGAAANALHGLQITKTFDATANGINDNVICTPTSDSQSYYGLNFTAEARASTYNITTVGGVNGFAGCGSLYRGTITSAIAIQSKITIAGALTGTDPICTSAYLFKGDSISATLGATIGTAYGLYLPSITAGSTNYSIYSAGGASYHAGAVILDSTLGVTGLITATASIKIGIAPTANSTGTVAIVAKDANLLTANAGWVQLQRSDGTAIYLPYWL